MTPPPPSRPPLREFLWNLATLQYTTGDDFARKAFSARLVLASIFTAAIVGYGLAQIAKPLAYLWIPLAITIWWLGAANPEHALYCPHCAKRVKAGATDCHHCGRDARRWAGQE